MGEKLNLGEVLRSVSKSDTGVREQIEYIDISLLDGDARNFYELTDIDQLAANIELFGLQQPLRVRANPDAEGRYIIVSGHRRRAALQMLVEAGNEKWAKVACIKEQGKDSEALQELRLIYANSDTRRLSSADISKQVERVEALLYQLKEEGYDFPGRMRDHVAEACKISQTKLARLKVIRDNLTPYFSKLYNENAIGESVAYEIAKMPHEHQTYMEVHQDLLAVSVRQWALSTAITYGRRLAEIDKITCKGGGECTNRKGKYAASLKRQPWESDFICAKCCSKCEKLISCKYACPGLAGKVKKLKADRKARQEQERIAQREKAMPEIREIQSYWERFGKARAFAGVDLDKCWEALGLGTCYHGDADKVMVMECLEHEFSSTSDIPYGWVLRRDDAKKLAKLADLLECSIDYLLCRTDIPQMATQAAPQPTGQLVFSGWMPGGTTPADPCDVVAVFDVGGPEPAKMLVYWTGREFTFKKNGAKIDMTPVKWMALPPDEDVEA